MDIRKELKSTKEDVVHAAVKSTVSLIPGVGNYLSEAFSLLVTQPAEKRKENILVMIDERLRQLEERAAVNLESLTNNDLFLSTVLQATQIAMRTHQKEKIIALLNAVSNVALNSSIDDNIVQMYLNFIDSFNEWHLRVLNFFDNPIHYYSEKGITTQNILYGSPMRALYSYYPELQKREAFTKQILTDLYQKGLFSTEPKNLITTTSVDGMMSSRTTDIGKDFIEFTIRMK